MRKLENWLFSFLEYTEGLKSPARFRLWAGISTVAGALQRRSWVYAAKHVIFPNQFIFLVGPPASGKSLAFYYAQELIRKVNSIHIAPMDCTQAAFYDCLEAALVQAYDRETRIPYIHHSLTAMIDELGTLVKVGDLDFLVALSKAYDAPPVFDKKTKHSGSNFVENVCFNLGAGCTAKYLADVLDEAILEQGFPSRVVFVYADERIVLVPGEIFDKTKAPDPQLAAALAHDLEAITALSGEFKLDPEMERLFITWAKSDFAPKPLDTRLLYYTERRLVHVLKLCMAVSVSRSDDLVITAEDLETARGLLLGAEEHMHLALEFVGQNQLWAQMQSVLKLVEALRERYKDGIPEHIIVHRLNREVHANMLDFVITNLLRSKELLLAPGSGDKLGERRFIRGGA